MKIEIIKPVIPQFVSDWIEQEKKCTTFHKSFSRAINLVKHDEYWREWEYEVGNRWSKIVATAWIHGYEVEQEPLYYAKIKGWEVSKGDIYWSLIFQEKSVFPQDQSDPRIHKTKLTKNAWNELGINKTNADFEEVGE